MNIINIIPVAVGLNITANAVGFQVQNFNLTPEELPMNARFYNVEGESKTEVSNIPFTLPKSVYDKWTTDSYLETESLKALNLTKV